MPMDNNQPDNSDFVNRVSKLINNSQKPSENASDKATKSKYSVPDSIDDTELDREVEQLLDQLNVDDGSDSNNGDIYDLLYVAPASITSTDRQLFDNAEKNCQQLQDMFLKTITDNYDTSSTDVDETADDLLRKMKDMAKLDSKYDQYVKQRDRDLEERYIKLKKDAPNLSDVNNVIKSDDNKPRGSVPSVLTKDELLDEMDDWCCICNEDAVVECEDCDDEDNKYCQDCFYHTHQSEEADYEATKHKSRVYRTRA